MRIRGIGDFFGSRQHGLPEFRFFDPEKDEDLLLKARAHATAVVSADPALERAQNKRFRLALETRYVERETMYEVG
jgi:ATP-dependent DNA helicase RecG